MSASVCCSRAQIPAAPIVCLALVLAACGLAGCSLTSDTTGPLNELLPGTPGLFWVGSCKDAQGVERRLTLKLDRHGAQIAAILAIQHSRLGTLSYQLSGTTGELPLTLRAEAGQSLTIERWIERENGLDVAGTLNTDYPVRGAFTARRIPRGRMIVLASHSYRQPPVGLVADDQGLLVSTAWGWYRVVPLAGAPVDSLMLQTGWHVFTGKAHTWDGLQFRVGIDSLFCSAIFTFTGGELPLEKVSLTHYTCGLACSGQVIWSLQRGTAALHRLDLDGAPQDSCIVEDPDVYRLARYGSRLLTQARLDRHLAVMSTDGTLEHVYDYPPEWLEYSPRGVEVTVAGEIYQLLMDTNGHGVLQWVALED